MEQSGKLREKILSAPDSCGVYLMRDCLGRVLYVGKAKALKKRLLNYLGRDLDGKTQSLMAKVADVEFRLAPNEAMALLLIDGGKGHLLTAQAELKALNLHIPLVSIAKEKENIYSSQPGKLTVALAKDGPALNLIRRIRDEAHRFAVGYHRLLRQEDLFR